MTSKRVTIDPNDKLTESQLKMLADLSKRSINYDDIPEFSEDQLKKFKKRANNTTPQSAVK